MRNDLQSMGPGRACAQASHAANAFTHEWGQRSDVKEWQRQTSQGFGTAIVLSLNKEKIKEVFKKLGTYLTKNWVVDPDYVIVVSNEISHLIDGKTITGQWDNKDGTTRVHRKEKTCAYVFGDKEELAPFLKDLPLY